MSFQRACVNCERCYGLANYIIDEPKNKGSEDSKNNLLNSDLLYSARNEAMKALENIGGNELFADEATHGLDACVACDFSKPAIKLYIHENVSKKEKAE